MTARTMPTLPNFAYQSVPTSAQLNQLATYQAFWANPPTFKMHQSATQTLTTSVYTTLTLDTPDWDSDSGRSNTTPFGYVIPFPGRWEMKWGGAFVANSTGVRVAILQQNGVNVTTGWGGFEGTPPAGVCAVQGSTRILCAIGDVITVQVQQTSGGNLNTAVGGPASWLEGKLESLATP